MPRNASCLGQRGVKKCVQVLLMTSLHGCWAGVCVYPTYTHHCSVNTYRMKWRWNVKTSWPIFLLLNLKTLKHRAVIFPKPTLYFYSEGLVEVQLQCCFLMRIQLLGPRGRVQIWGHVSFLIWLLKIRTWIGPVMLWQVFPSIPLKGTRFWRGSSPLLTSDQEVHRSHDFTY